MKKLLANDIGKGEIFKHKALEIFTKTPPLFIVLYYGFIIVLFLYIHVQTLDMSVIETILVFLSAILFWTFFEYIMHRFVFHFINDKAWSKKFHFAIHGIHHQYPRDEERLFMPPLPGTVIIGILTFIFYLFLGQLTYLWMFGFLIGWAMYVSIHYVIHVYQPIKPFRFLWTHHAKHHYKNEHSAYGVSSPIWDIIFGTMPDDK